MTKTSSVAKNFPPSPHSHSSVWKQLWGNLKWTRASYYLMSAFIAVLGLIIYIWYPLAEEYLAMIDPNYPIWLQLDWLLIGIFLAMSLLIMAGADIKKDIWIVIVGLFGGLAIESWGTQTNLWFYYTNERPPLWIIPAWPIASLSIDRLIRILDLALPPSPRLFKITYWIIFPFFYLLLLVFVAPTFDKSLTWMSVLLCTFLILTPTDHRLAVLTFVAGSGLGYFLERWGTTRECWTYYTYQTPPFFAVLAHGLAAVSFWRAALLLKKILKPIRLLKDNPPLFSGKKTEQNTIRNIPKSRRINAFCLGNSPVFNMNLFNFFRRITRQWRLRLLKTRN